MRDPDISSSLASTAAKASKPKPIKGRALQTYNRLLDAATQIIADEGLEGLNTNAVATAAGINISTLYSYFSDKYALVEGLLERFQETQLAITEVELAANSDKSLRVERLIDGLLAALLESPWLLSLNDALLASPRLQPLREASLQQMTDALIAKLNATADAPQIPAAQQQASFRLLLEMYLSGLRLAVNAEPAQRALLVTEFKRLINSYLNNYR